MARVDRNARNRPSPAAFGGTLSPLTQGEGYVGTNCGAIFSRSARLNTVTTCDTARE